jgi:hypothetical protein
MLASRFVMPVTTARGNGEGGVGVGVATGDDEAGCDEADVGETPGDSAGDGFTVMQPARVAAATARTAPRNVARFVTRLS